MQRVRVNGVRVPKVPKSLEKWLLEGSNPVQVWRQAGLYGNQGSAAAVTCTMWRYLLHHGKTATASRNKESFHALRQVAFLT
jgi:hypothetical protein